MERTENEKRLITLADRFAIVLAWVASQKRDAMTVEPRFEPFDDDEFWTSQTVDQMRAMPDYQKALEVIRQML